MYISEWHLRRIVSNTKSKVTKRITLYNRAEQKRISEHAARRTSRCTSYNRRKPQESEAPAVAVFFFFQFLSRLVSERI